MIRKLHGLIGQGTRAVYGRKIAVRIRALFMRKSRTEKHKKTTSATVQLLFLLSRDYIIACYEKTLS